MIKRTNSFIKKGFSRIGKGFLKVIQINYWLDWARVKAGTSYLKQSVVTLFTPQKEIKAESFKVAVKTFQLNEAELLIKQKALFRLSIMMLCAAVLIFSYAIYQLLYGSIHATLISLVVMGIALVLAFRYHFWYFQIKNHKLGCTFQEWLRALKGGSHE